MIVTGRRASYQPVCVCVYDSYRETGFIPTSVCVCV